MRDMEVSLDAQLRKPSLDDTCQSVSIGLCLIESEKPHTIEEAHVAQAEPDAIVNTATHLRNNG